MYQQPAFRVEDHLDQESEQSLAEAKERLPRNTKSIAEFNKFCYAEDIHDNLVKNALKAIFFNGIDDTDWELFYRG